MDRARRSRIAPIACTASRKIVQITLFLGRFRAYTMRAIARRDGAGRTSARDARRKNAVSPGRFRFFFRARCVWFAPTTRGEALRVDDSSEETHRANTKKAAGGGSKKTMSKSGLIQ